MVEREPRHVTYGPATYAVCDVPLVAYTYHVRRGDNVEHNLNHSFARISLLQDMSCCAS